MKPTPILLAAALLALPPLAVASTLVVSPSRVELSAQRPTASVQLVNAGVEVLSLRVSALPWPGLPGALAPDPTPLIVERGVVVLGPGQRRTLQVALLDRGAAAAGRNFRLHFTALPTARRLADIGPAMAPAAPLALPVQLLAADVVEPTQWPLACAAGDAKKGVRRRPPRRHYAKAPRQRTRLAQPAGRGSAVARGPAQPTTA